MIEDSFNNSTDYSVADDPTLYYGDDRGQKNKTDLIHQQQQQDELRHSNRDSGISSEKQRQQQQQQPKITQHMSQFLSDTMKSSQSFEKTHTRSYDDHAMDYSMNVDGKVLNKKALQFLSLADDWELRKAAKERQLYHHKSNHRSSPPLSSLPPTSNMQEGARGEINPTRISDRLTPEIEILQENKKRKSKQQQSNFNSNHYGRRAAETRRPSESRKHFQLNVRPLTRPNSRQHDQHRDDSSVCNSCTSSRKCCHHTYYYVYNYLNEHHRSDFENRHDRRRIQKPTLESTDDRILTNLALVQAECTQYRRIAKASRKYSEYDDDVFLLRYNDRRLDKKTVEFGSIDSGIEEPFEKQKTEIPTLITSHTIMSLLNFNKKYEFLTNLARNILILRKNVRNLVTEFEAALNRHSDLLKRYISRLELQLPKTVNQKCSDLEKEIAEARKNLLICNEKTKEFEAAILRDKNTWQKLPEGNSRTVPDMDYQRRLIYEIFMS